MLGPDLGSELGHAFGDPVLGAQKVFRAVLQALSEPGTVHVVSEPVSAPMALHASSARLLLTLSDFETPVWMEPSAAAEAGAWVRFHCAAPLAAEPVAARFAVLDGKASAPPLSAFNAGEDRYPDKSATLIVQVASLEGGTPVTLAGPGIEGVRSIAPAGLAEGFWDAFAANGARYPLGVDLVLVAGDAIMGLPRSVKATLASEAS